MISLLRRALKGPSRGGLCAAASLAALGGGALAPGARAADLLAFQNVDPPFVTGQPGDGDTNVWTIDPDTGAARALTAGPGFDGQPRWSPDGTRLAFSSDRAGSRDIWTMRADGADPRAVTSGPADDEQPAWSPDGTRVVFVRRDASGVALVTARTDGAVQRVLESVPCCSMDKPRWSPDGRWIAFGESVTLTGAPGSVVVVGADGTPRRSLGSGSDPEWSPDSARLAFGGPELTTVSPDGTDPRGLGGPGESPAWTPDGRTLVFKRPGPVDATGQLHRISVTGTGDVALTAPGWSQFPDERDPEVAPDGARVAFELGSTEPGSMLALASVSSGGPRALLSGRLFETDPVWRPAPAPPAPGGPGA
ncbi:MAG: exported protein of unknown function, partial [Solirubrobacterales bacterium]|nr:exported protein of unknown function [Solirubrobacterales bacterium]